MHTPMTNESLRTFTAIVWVGELAGERVQVVARNLGDASYMLWELYGAEAVVSLWNEEDANAPRRRQAALKSLSLNI
jgi:hypothetical protein